MLSRLVFRTLAPSRPPRKIALTDGYRESEESWKALLLDWQARVLTTAPLPKVLIHEFWQAETKAAVEKAFDLFLGDLRGEVSQGDRLSGEGSRVLAGLL